nr:hypothetical protein [Candidatus Saccharibacteria bacterium]NIW79797.1 hypothetical protein [Calditrichia bacterium]
WFIGGALAGYAMFYLHAGLHLDMVTIWFFWVMFLDTPHFFGTYLRTYFDKEEFQKRKRLLLWSLSWLLFGPLMIGLSYLLHYAGFMNYSTPFLFFVLFFNLWAYWHVVRQHFGIMSLYKKKNNDYHPSDTRADKAILYGGLVAPLAAFVVRHPEAREVFGFIGDYPSLPIFEGNILSTFFSIDYWNQLHWEHYVVFLSIAVFTSVVLYFIYRQLYRYRRGMPLNLPKLLFLTVLIPLYAMICFSSAVLTAPLLAFSAFVTIYHDIQYHAIVWFYSRNRYHEPQNDPNKYGLAVKLSKNVVVFLLCGIAMGGTLRLLGCTFELHPGCGALVLTSTKTLFGDLTTKQLLLSIFIGIPLHHYFVDQFIWRPSKDKTLQKDLKLNNR